MECNAGCSRASPRAGPLTGGCHGTLVQERVPSVWHSALDTIPAVSDWQHLSDPSCRFCGAVWPPGCGSSRTGIPRSPAGFPGVGVECLCFICLIKTKASRAAQGAQPSGAGTLHKVNPRGSPGGRAGPRGSRVSGFPGSRTTPEDSATAGPLFQSLPRGRSRPCLGKTSPMRRLFSRGGSLSSGRAPFLGAKGSPATWAPIFPR
ncbi:uncharacterized protein LOC126645409 [Myiozetetes cayanensis]|uniref:uncharacterized protein LOC126645409 n=1 Tax=Myiozetetes cayanensis TaxID=478635 RepID=UPI00215EDCD5|nr:uncharacterized protein LOC126645409 [Myiozetetes cayanensis]